MATYYLSPTGSDSTGTGTSLNPWATIAHADGLLSPGDTVRLLAGTYLYNVATFDAIDTHTSGTSGSRITWMSDVVGATELVSTGSSTVFWRSRGSYVDHIGFEMTGTGANLVYGIGVEGSFCSVQSCYVHDINQGPCSSGTGGAGIYIGNPTFTNTNVDVFGCKTANIGSASCLFIHGIYSTTQIGTIANNVCYGNGGWGIHFHHNAGAYVCHSNLCFTNGHGGIQVSSSGTEGHATIDNMLVANNICYNNLGGNGGISDFLGGSNNQYLNNDSYGNSAGNYIIAAGTQTNNLSVDPLFAYYQADGSGNYRLAQGSPCIGAGTSTSAPAADYEGNTRGYRGRYDIGPYQFTPSFRGF